MLAERDATYRRAGARLAEVDHIHEDTSAEMRQAYETQLAEKTHVIRMMTGDLMRVKRQHNKLSAIVRTWMSDAEYQEARAQAAHLYPQMDWRTEAEIAALESGVPE